MAVQLPTFADLPSLVPQPSGALPSFSKTDPVAEGEEALGKGLQKAGIAASDWDLSSQLAKDKLEEANATVDLFSRVDPLKAQIAKETDPAKVAELKAQANDLLNTSGQAIANPLRRQMWTAQHTRTIGQLGVEADTRNTELGRQQAVADIHGMADKAIRTAVGSDDPQAMDIAQGAINDSAQYGRQYGAITPDQAYTFTKQRQAQLYVGKADRLLDQGNAAGASALLEQHRGDLDPIALERLQLRINRVKEKQGVVADTNALWGGADKGYTGNRAAVTSQQGDVGQKVSATLRARGWTDAAIVGALNNGITESGLDPNITGAGGEKGVFQFHPDSHLPVFTAAYGNDKSPEAQASYVADVIEKTMPGYAQSGDSKSATARFFKEFEKPADQSDAALAARGGNTPKAQAILARTTREPAEPSAADASGTSAPPATDTPELRAQYKDYVKNKPRVTKDPGYAGWLNDFHPELVAGTYAYNQLHGSGGDTTGSPAPGETQPQQPGGLPPLRDINALTQRAQDKADSGEWTQEHANAVQSALRSRYNHVQANQATDRATLLRRMNNGLAMLTDGKDFDIDPATVRHFFPPDQADEFIQKLQDAKDGGQLVKGLATAAPADVEQQRAQLAAGLNDPTATDYAKRSRMLSLFDEAAKKRDQALVGPHADPVAYLVENSPVIQQKRVAIAADPKNPQVYQDFATAALAEQTRLGVPPEKQHVLGTKAATGISTAISADAEHAPATMQGLAAQYGQAWPHVYSDLVTLGKLPAGFQVVGQLADYDQANASVLARALGASSKDDKAFERLTSSKAPGGKSIEDVVKQTIPTDERIVSYERSLADSGASPSQIVSIRGAIEHLAAGRAIFLHEAPDEATEKAMDAVVGHYRFMPNGGARVPADKMDTVSSNAGAVLHGLSVDNVSIPAIYGRSPADPKPDEYLTMLQSAPTWITGPKADRLLLLDHGGRLVTGKDGQPVAVPFDMPRLIPLARQPLVPVIGEAP